MPNDESDITDSDVFAVIAPLYNLSTGMTRVIASKPVVNRLAVLQTVGHAGSIRPSEIANALGLHQSSVTRTLRALEDAGQVELTEDPDDRRSCFVTLTEAGTGERERLTALGLDKWQRFLAGWERSEVAELARLLAKLERSVSETHAFEQPRGKRWQGGEAR